jgi:hypothetical protein
MTSNASATHKPSPAPFARLASGLDAWSVQVTAEQVDQAERALTAAVALIPDERLRTAVLTEFVRQLRMIAAQEPTP